MKVGGKGRGIF